MKFNCSELLKALMEEEKKSLKDSGKKWTAELISILEKRPRKKGDFFFLHVAKLVKTLTHFLIPP